MEVGTYSSGHTTLIVLRTVFMCLVLLVDFLEDEVFDVLLEMEELVEMLNFTGESCFSSSSLITRSSARLLMGEIGLGRLDTTLTLSTVGEMSESLESLEAEELLLLLLEDLLEVLGLMLRDLG